MVYPKQNFTDMDLSHAVEFPECDVSVNTGRERSTGRTRIFLIFHHTGRAFARYRNAWSPLANDDARLVLALAASSDIPRYRASGSPDSLILQ